MRLILLIVLLLIKFNLSSQTNCVIEGTIESDKNKVFLAVVKILELNKSIFSDKNGYFKFEEVPFGVYTLIIEEPDYETVTKTISLSEELNSKVIIQLKPITNLEDIVVTGTLKVVQRSESPVVVDVLTQKFLRKNPTPSIFDALQTVNGIRPQINCSVCNTGDIHINGLEGPYTMVLIDGMPIVSSLSTVYGLTGIPNSMIERIEIVKGPASSLYGSEAIGGLINIITKPTYKAPKLTFDFFTTSWGEVNSDISFTLKPTKRTTILNGINYFNYNQKIDKNGDNFKDLSLQNRISLFQKWNFERKENRVFTIAARYLYEDRWGGDVNWNKSFRGGDSIYGESIYTSRVELLGKYELPTKEKMFLTFSFNTHNQNSFYGTTSYIAKQTIGFLQYNWFKKINRHELLLGTAYRYTYYDDNTTATEINDSTSITNNPSKVNLPGIFVQDEIKLSEKQNLLLGFRYDYNNFHGNIFTPRMAYKYTINRKNILRINAGTGFRVVNVFTEDHAALTGSRIVEIETSLNPEKSYNLNINYLKNFYLRKSTILSLDFTGFYTYFDNRIIADYLTDPNKIIYTNLNGFAENKGLSLNVDLSFKKGLKLLAGATFMENSFTENGLKLQQLLTEKFTGVWSISYKINRVFLTLDYTGNVYSPMELPLLNELDPRARFSPWWSIQNIQLTFDKFKNVEFYGGVKNLLNWTPFKGNPFLISRTNDPFDKEVQYNVNGEIIATPSNPYALNFDASYIYAPTQGIRFFFGLRMKID
jgi:outer membrane receptor for ferrienterochelin and colicins